jgi:hypothetical protein
VVVVVVVIPPAAAAVVIVVRHGFALIEYKGKLWYVTVIWKREQAILGKTVSALLSSCSNPCLKQHAYVLGSFCPWGSPYVVWVHAGRARTSKKSI